MGVGVLVVPSTPPPPENCLVPGLTLALYCPFHGCPGLRNRVPSILSEFVQWRLDSAYGTSREIFFAKIRVNFFLFVSYQTVMS